ncbi:MAG: toll/interleukin-1 receptor domain-containing protein [Verrucomicrobiales bacterium]|nr:toll/interleukin-1 receptor domain-containing protein [Verrucomicrobiales bacterium]
MNKPVFISYSRLDQECMHQIREILRSKGMEVWTDEGIEPGTPLWKKTISDAIIGCQYVVVLFSPDSSESTWVNRELDFAELHKKRIFPFLIRGNSKESIPFGYTTYQFIDARGGEDVREKAVQILLDCIAKENPGSPPGAGDSAQSEGANTESAEGTSALWRWSDFPELSICIPASWTATPSTEESWRRAQLLLMGGENYFYRWIQDEDLFLYKATGIPGARMEPKLVLSDITGMTPLVGFLAVQSYPFPIPSSCAPLGFRFCFGRFVKYLEKRFSSTFNEHYWLEGRSGKVLAMVSTASRDGDVYRGCSYMIFPPLSKHPINLHIGCDGERFAREQSNFDRIAQTLLIR